MDSTVRQAIKVACMSLAMARGAIPELGECVACGGSVPQALFDPEPDWLTEDLIEFIADDGHPFLCLTCWFGYLSFRLDIQESHPEVRFFPDAVTALWLASKARHIVTGPPMGPGMRLPRDMEHLAFAPSRKRFPQRPRSIGQRKSDERRRRD
jgi:hypothetical protein